MNIEKKTFLEFYTTMLKIRLFEERIVDLYARGLVPGLAHLYIGEEAVASGVCAVLRPIADMAMSLPKGLTLSS